VSRAEPQQRRRTALPAAGATFGILLLLAPAGLVTIARLVPGSGLAWVVLRALTPYVVVPYGVLALLLAGLTARAAGPARLLPGVGLVVALALLGLHVLWAAGPFTGRVATPVAGRTFTVLTLNLHLGHAAAGALMRAAAHEDADLLVLEEVTPTALDRLELAGAVAAFPYRAGQALPGRDGTVVLSRHPLTSRTAVPTRSPAVRVDVRVAGDTVHLLAGHPTAPNNGVAAWRSDLQVLAEAARALPGPVLVAGDLNATVDHPPLQDLLDAGFRDAAGDARAGWAPTWPASGSVVLFGFRVPPLFALDHVLLRGPLRAVEVHTVTVPDTDHRALVATVSWAAGTGPG